MICSSSFILGNLENLILKTIWIFFFFFPIYIPDNKKYGVLYQSKYFVICSYVSAAEIKWLDQRSSETDAKDRVFHLGLLGHALNWSLVVPLMAMPPGIFMTISEVQFLPNVLLNNKESL